MEGASRCLGVARRVRSFLKGRVMGSGVWELKLGRSVSQCEWAIDFANVRGGDEMSIVRQPLFQAQSARTPVAVIVSQDYALLPYKLPRAYVVLGWFWIVDAWVGGWLQR